MAQYFEVFSIFLRLGLTSFGGPIAHLGYFHAEFVERKKWIKESDYSDLVALCQFLPGPASSQVGMAIGLQRAGFGGAIAAWLGFTLPSAILLILFGLGLSQFPVSTSWLHGLKIVAVAVVAQAVGIMAKKLCPDQQRVAIAIVTAVVATIYPSTLTQLLVIVFGGVTGLAFLRESNSRMHDSSSQPIRRAAAVVFLSLFATLILILPVAAKTTEFQSLKLFDSFFRAGSLVFGGGHVVLPLLRAEVVPTGWVSDEIFLAGYGAAQAVPGPLFTFAAYLGAVSKVEPAGWLGGMLCLIAAFLPSFLLVAGALPFWQSIRKRRPARSAMLGINASVVGLLAAALYNPVWTSAIFSPQDFALAAIGLLLLVTGKIPVWLIVASSALIGGLFL